MFIRYFAMEKRIFMSNMIFQIRLDADYHIDKIIEQCSWEIYFDK